MGRRLEHPAVSCIGFRTDILSTHVPFLLGLVLRPYSPTKLPSAAMMKSVQSGEKARHPPSSMATMARRSPGFPLSQKASIWT